jgi:transposase
MQLYAGLDLHSRSTFVGILDQDFNRVFKKRMPNDLQRILADLAPFKQQLKGLVVESTYNWYWLVDGLMDAGFQNVCLANPSAIKQYEGIKHTDDQHDAFFLARLLILGILPQGYIYPKKDRAVRDLARKRMFLTQQKTSNLVSLQSLVERNCALRLSANRIRSLKVAELEKLLSDKHLFFNARANLETVQFLTGQIRQIEKAIVQQIKPRPGFELLKTVPGIGPILAMTIMLEAGDIRRFAKVGNFASYCRCVSSPRFSAGKLKGSGNRKNGNRYLSWAFVEAAHMARRFCDRFRRYYDRKASQTNTCVATKALSNKLARICYYILRDQVPFREELIHG